jgi:RinA family phage transcriptional activator
MSVTKGLSHARYRHIEAELYNYHVTKQKMLYIEQNEVYRPRNYDEKVQHNAIANPTAQAAINLAMNDKLNHMKRMTGAIEEVLAELDDEKKHLVELRYWQNMEWSDVADTLYVSRPTIYSWRSAIIFKIAVKLGWEE